MKRLPARQKSIRTREQRCSVCRRLGHNCRTCRRVRMGQGWFEFEDGRGF